MGLLRFGWELETLGDLEGKRACRSCNHFKYSLVIVVWIRFPSLAASQSSTGFFCLGFGDFISLNQSIGTGQDFGEGIAASCLFRALIGKSVRTFQRFVCVLES